MNIPGQFESVLQKIFRFG